MTKLMLEAISRELSLCSYQYLQDWGSQTIIYKLLVTDPLPTSFLISDMKLFCGKRIRMSFCLPSLCRLAPRGLTAIITAFWFPHIMSPAVTCASNLGHTELCITCNQVELWAADHKPIACPVSLLHSWFERLFNPLGVTNMAVIYKWSVYTSKFASLAFQATSNSANPNLNVVVIIQCNSHFLIQL